MSKVKTVVFKPDEPIVIGEGENQQQFAELLFSRNMKGKDLARMDLVEGDIRKGYAMFASMCGVPITVFDEMDADDIERLQIETAHLLGKRGKGVLAALEATDQDNTDGEV